MARSSILPHTTLTLSVPEWCVLALSFCFAKIFALHKSYPLLLLLSLLAIPSNAQHSFPTYFTSHTDSIILTYTNRAPELYDDASNALSIAFHSSFLHVGTENEIRERPEQRTKAVVGEL